MDILSEISACIGSYLNYIPPSPQSLNPEALQKTQKASNPEDTEQNNAKPSGASILEPHSGTPEHHVPDFVTPFIDP